MKCSTHTNYFPNHLNLTAHDKPSSCSSFFSALSDNPRLFFFFFGGETHRSRTVSKQQQKQQRVQHHGQRPHSAGCCGLSLRDLFSDKTKKITQVFACVLAPPLTLSSGKNRDFLGRRGHIHPLAPGTHAPVRAAGRNLVTTKRRKKSFGSWM